MDWKEALSAARNNFDEAPEKSVHDQEEVSEEKNKDIIQKNSLQVVIDKKGRNGKIATIIEGFVIPQEEVEDIARKLKQKLGVGGSVRDGEILIQGNHLDKVKDFLINLKYKVK